MFFNHDFIWVFPLDYWISVKRFLASYLENQWIKTNKNAFLAPFVNNYEPDYGRALKSY